MKRNERVLVMVTTLVGIVLLLVNIGYSFGGAPMNVNGVYLLILAQGFETNARLRAKHSSKGEFDG